MISLVAAIFWKPLESHSYLLSVTAAELWWHLSNINVMFNACTLFWYFRTTGIIMNGKRRFCNPHLVQTHIQNEAFHIYVCKACSTEFYLDDIAFYFATNVWSSPQEADCCHSLGVIYSQIAIPAKYHSYIAHVQRNLAEVSPAKYDCDSRLTEGNSAKSKISLTENS